MAFAIGPDAGSIPARSIWPCARMNYAGDWCKGQHRCLQSSQVAGSIPVSPAIFSLMTDIQRHLPKIIKTVRAQMQADMLAADETPAHLEQRISRSLRALLPASYGIGAGTTVNKGKQRSQAVRLLIYDLTRAGKQP